MNYVARRAATALIKRHREPAGRHLFPHSRKRDMCRFKYHVDVPKLFRLWNDSDYTRVEIARELGLRERQLQDVAARYGLGPRGACHRAFSMEDAESPEEDAASGQSLALSPWVAARIKELRLGMPA